PLDVAHLSTGHAAGAAAGGQFRHQRDAHRRVGVAGGVGQHAEGVGQQRIAGQDRGGLVIGLVDGGAAAPQRVVVHGGQVVVDERIAMHHLDGEAGRQGGGGRHGEDGGG